MSGQHCFIGLGSNIGDGLGIIRQALEALAQNNAINVLRVSSMYCTAAWGRPDQPDFTNAVAEITTTLSGQQLLQSLLQLELELGRTRDTGHWGPRLIDLDLLTYADEQISSPELTVPHPRMHERAFVLVPLLELESEFEIPGLGSAREWQKKLQKQLIQRIN
ncbi:MAG: 2-amino-4-hydroxy-6-hydroxymethyldihydropteridine diphosphokinase [Xanthomonadales bacterium]|nr:2-amino-4-hydroxy-6-hydroxymethyldihydropteridine diphosphokinase [Xanthomonadales bacterium]